MRVHVGLGGGIGVAPPPPSAASGRKICNLCHRAGEPLASIGELPPPSVSVGGGGWRRGWVCECGVGGQIGNGPGLSPAEGAGHGAAWSHSHRGRWHYARRGAC